MLGATAIMLFWPIANAMTLAEAKPAAGIELWSDMHAAMDTAEIHGLARRLSSDLKRANITSPKVFFYEDVENFKRHHGWHESDDFEFEGIDERSDVSEDSIQCTSPKCEYKPSLGFGKFPGGAYRNVAGNSFCRFVLSIPAGKARLIGFDGYHSTCGAGMGDDCSVRFIVAAQKGKLGSEIAANYANCEDAVGAVYAKCDLKSGHAKCGTNDDPKSFAVAVLALTASGAKCQGKYCKEVDCLQSTDC